MSFNLINGCLFGENIIFLEYKCYSFSTQVYITSLFLLSDCLGSIISSCSLTSSSNSTTVLRASEFTTLKLSNYFPFFEINMLRSIKISENFKRKGKRKNGIIAENKQTKAAIYFLLNSFNKHFLKIDCVWCWGYKDKQSRDLARQELRVQIKMQKCKLIIKHTMWPQTLLGMRGIRNTRRKNSYDAEEQKQDHLTILGI